MSCDFESLYYNLKQELLDVFREAEKPVPRVKLKDLRSARICGLANLAKMILYFEILGIVLIVNRDEHYQNWEVDIQAQVLDVLFEQI
ncbi:hypothetical protein [Hydrogenivirga sp. 128-5-R1-1]|uniref:hypothetical protein n=1 Tax=Hydrogenivirga sp. 128-5-R1-1 TaxID=392423 RepID=UPI00015F3685|nr:hypothetical protein [Hydrogenivirga sp. 128-5-R1-1]EDP76654.1 hypothetical protein HG1285_03568 [Hydrogenivirga sp. 128-5-R1-1]